MKKGIEKLLFAFSLLLLSIPTFNIVNTIQRYTRIRIPNWLATAIYWTGAVSTVMALMASGAGVTIPAWIAKLALAADSIGL